jgi:hypothetical protein
VPLKAASGCSLWHRWQKRPGAPVSGSGTECACRCASHSLRARSGHECGARPRRGAGTKQAQLAAAHALGALRVAGRERGGAAADAAARPRGRGPPGSLRIGRRPAQQRVRQRRVPRHVVAAVVAAVGELLRQASAARKGNPANNRTAEWFPPRARQWLQGAAHQRLQRPREVFDGQQRVARFGVGHRRRRQRQWSLAGAKGAAVARCAERPNLARATAALLRLTVRWEGRPV